MGKEKTDVCKSCNENNRKEVHKIIHLDIRKIEYLYFNF